MHLFLFAVSPQNIVTVAQRLEMIDQAFPPEHLSSTDPLMHLAKDNAQDPLP